MPNPTAADVASALPTRQAALDLWREYVSWTLCRRALKAATDATATFGIGAPDTTVFLENAMMSTLLQPAVTRPEAILGNLPPEALAKGLACVPEPQTVSPAALIDAVRAAIAGVLATAPARLWESPYPPASTADDGVTLGDFTLRWSRPVAHAYAHLRAAHDAATAAEILLRAALRYDAIFAETRHIGPPQVVYDAFYAWGIRNEGFASPFNARLLGKAGARFFSAFADTDGPFGSQGSFFACDPTRYDGGWCLDPPFLPSTMALVDEIIARMRTRAEAPPIILIVPASHRVANTPDETVTLQAGVHVVEGLGDSFFTLPVDVTIHRYGELPGFCAETIRAGYCHPNA